MAKLAPSILSADFSRLGEQIQLVQAHADLFHIDVMDGHFVPPITIGPLVVEWIRPTTEVPFHGHLMVDVPEQYFEHLASAGLDTVSFHLEAVDDPAPVIRKARDAGMRAGLVLSPETPAEAAVPYLDELDDVMVMGVHPGWGGQPFIPEALTKTEFLRAELDRRGSSADLQVDGGVKEANARRVLEAGASVLIAGSAIFSEPDPAEAARRLAELAKGA